METFSCIKLRLFVFFYTDINAGVVRRSVLDKAPVFFLHYHPKVVSVLINKN